MQPLFWLIHPPSTTRTERSTSAPHNTGKQILFKVKGQPTSAPELRQALSLGIKNHRNCPAAVQDGALHTAVKPHLGRWQKGLRSWPEPSKQSVRAEWPTPAGFKGNLGTWFPQSWESPPWGHQLPLLWLHTLQEANQEQGVGFEGEQQKALEVSKERLDVALGALVWFTRCSGLDFYSVTGWTRLSQRSFPASMIVWFCELQTQAGSEWVKLSPLITCVHLGSWSSAVSSSCLQNPPEFPH